MMYVKVAYKTTTNFQVHINEQNIQALPAMLITFPLKFIVTITSPH